MTCVTPTKKVESLAMDPAKLTAYPIALALGFVAPSILAGLPQVYSFQTHQILIVQWQFFPSLVAFWLFALSVWPRLRKSVPRAAYSSPEAKLRHTQLVYRSVLGLTAATHLTTLAVIIYPKILLHLFPELSVSSISVTSTLVPMSVISPRQIVDTADGALTVLNYDMYSSTGAILIWSLNQIYNLDGSMSAVVTAIYKSIPRSILVGPAGAALWNIWDRDVQLLEAVSRKQKK